MVFKLSQKLAGKPEKVSNSLEVSTTSTPGGFRVTTSAAVKMGVSAGDYILLGLYETGNAAGSKTPAIAKVTKDTAGACKLAYASGKDGTGNLNFSCAYAYKELGGTSGNLKVFTVGEVVQPTDDAGNVIEGGASAYPLVWKEDRPKQTREKVAKTPATTPVTTEAAINTANTASAKAPVTDEFGV